MLVAGARAVGDLVEFREVRSQSEPVCWPDLAGWDSRPPTQMIPEKAAVACPYVGGSQAAPRDPRTLRRWREARTGPAFLKIGGRYFYTVAALREFYERSLRGS